MRISYFEEFSTPKNISRLNLITSPTKLYLAAKSVEDFNSIKKNIKSKQVMEIIYWPILEKKEGYWISPWSKRKALLRIFSELQKQRIPVMLDLELPTRHNPWLFLTQKANFFRNKKLISSFINNYKGQVYLAEYYPEGKLKEKIMSFCGLHYSSKKIKVIKMLYHSLHHFNKEFIVKEIKRGKEEFGNNYLLALGTIARGVNGTESILSSQQLKQDLRLANKLGIKEVILFRLGGLNKEYVKILNSFDGN
ncbi:MAG: hypothetical protein WCV90_03415 [Candidatus Woesearchaeota archaeon]|jgi:hypothetical protein